VTRGVLHCAGCRTLGSDKKKDFCHTKRRGRTLNALRYLVGGGVDGVGGQKEETRQKRR